MSDTTTPPAASTPILDAISAARPAAPPAPLAAPSADAAKPDDAKASDAPAADVAKPPRLNPYAKRIAVAKPIAPPAPPVVAPEAPRVDDPRIAALSSELDAMRGVIARQASSELAALPENIRKYVETTAGDNPARRLDAIAALRASGIVTVPAAVPSGATTLPQAPSPPAADAPSATDAAVLAEYERLAKSSPILSAAFERSNRAALARARERGARN